MSYELALPQIRQVTSFGCGAAALASVLRYLGKETACECRLMATAGTSEQDGTTPGGLVRAAALYGVRAEVWEETSLEAVCEAVEAARPVLVALQAWTDKPRESRPALGYRGEWDDGHWCALTAAGPRRLVFMDPSLPCRGTLTRVEFMRRWHDVEADGDQYYRLAIVFPAPSEPKRRRVGRVSRMG